MNKKIAYIFPTLGIWDKASLIQQLEKVTEEHREVLKAFNSESTLRLAEELDDLMTACQGALHIIEKETGIKQSIIIKERIEKNKNRNY